MYEYELNKLKQEYNLKLGQLEALKSEKDNINTKILILKNDVEELNKEKIILEKTTSEARKEAKNKLETLMTNALQYIFGNSYSAEIELGTSGGKPTAEIYLVTKVPNPNSETGYDIIKTVPEDDNGGGVVDILSVSLRIAMLELFNSSCTMPISGPIIFDEAGKHVSDGYSTKLVEFMNFIAKKLNKQIILVTHNSDFRMADKKFFVKFINDTSVITEAKDLDLQILFNKEGN